MTDNDCTVKFDGVKAIGFSAKLHEVKKNGEVIDVEQLTAVTIVAQLDPGQIKDIAMLQMHPEAVTVSLTTAQIPMFGKEPA